MPYGERLCSLLGSVSLRAVNYCAKKIIGKVDCSPVRQTMPMSIQGNNEEGLFSMGRQALDSLTRSFAMSHETGLDSVDLVSPHFPSLCLTIYSLLSGPLLIGSLVPITKNMWGFINLLDF